MTRPGSWERKTWEDLASTLDVPRGAVKVVHDVESPFGEFLTVSRTPIIELNSSYGLSALRDRQNFTGGGNASSTEGEIVLNTSTTPSSTSKVDSAEVGRYVPGYAAEIGIGIRMPSAPVGNQIARFGGLGQDDDNGLYFGRDSTGYFTAILRNGVETKTYQSDWSVDKLDGLGDSGFNLLTSTGNIFQVNFTWYGYGAIEFGIVGTVAGKQRFIPCHTVSGFNQTSIVSPNLRVFAEVNNGGDSTNLQLFLGGRQYSIIGRYLPKFRFTGNFRGSVATTTTVRPLISFRRKAGFNDRAIKLSGFDTLAASDPHVVEVRVGGTLTGASWATPTNHTASETALESDISATAITNGIVVWQQIVSGGLGQQTSLTAAEVGFDLPDNSIVTLCTRALTGTGTVSSAFRLREEW